MVSCGYFMMTCVVVFSARQLLVSVCVCFFSHLLIDRTRYKKKKRAEQEEGWLQLSLIRSQEKGEKVAFIVTETHASRNSMTIWDGDLSSLGNLSITMSPVIGSRDRERKGARFNTRNWTVLFLLHRVSHRLQVVKCHMCKTKYIERERERCTAEEIRWFRSCNNNYLSCHATFNLHTRGWRLSSACSPLPSGVGCTDAFFSPASLGIQREREKTKVQQSAKWIKRKQGARWKKSAGEEKHSLKQQRPPVYGFTIDVSISSK